MIVKDQKKYAICYRYDSVRIKCATDRNGSAIPPSAVVGGSGTDSIIWLDRLKANGQSIWMTGPRPGGTARKGKVSDYNRNVFSIIGCSGGEEDQESRQRRGEQQTANQ